MALSCARVVPLAFVLAGSVRHARQGLKAKTGSYHMKVLVEQDGSCEIVESKWGQVHRLAHDSVFQSEPKYQWEDNDGVGTHSSQQVIDFWGPSEDLVSERAGSFCAAGMHHAVQVQNVDVQNTEVRCIACSGNSDNRIDVVMMGDGYTMEERGKFFEDMERLKDDMFAGETFQSWLPVFNIWAIHVPAAESGIGYNSRPKDTPFRLYKEGNIHRAVFPGNAGAARQVCQLADGCDYPSIIGNDDFYGGLGGEFVIGTRSKTTGTIVLRHEMGHNFVDVGEEYDTGYVYDGVNSDRPGWFSSKPKQNIKWKHWLTEPDAPVREEKMRMALAKYPWADLANGEQTFQFTSDGTYYSWRMSFTVTGCPEEGSLRVTLDGEPLDWHPTSPFGAERSDGHTVDRQFYHFGSNVSKLSKGTHTLKFSSGFAPDKNQPMRQLCSVRVHEYGSPDKFHYEPDYVGAYPTWNNRNSKSFRPTDEFCLMRDMELKRFCPVCKEGMWLQFLSRMELIDGFDVSRNTLSTTVKLLAVPLAQFRQVQVANMEERYEVQWTKNGRAMSEFNGMFEISGADMSGTWKARLQYFTSEVRKDPNGLLVSTKSITLA